MRRGGRSRPPLLQCLPLLVGGGLARIQLPVREKRVFMDNLTAPMPLRSGFNFPRYDARMLDGDEVQLASIHGTWLSISFDPSLTLRGRTLALQAANGRYCAVDPDNPEGQIRCDQYSPPFSAWLEVSEGRTNVSFRGLRGGKYCSDGPRGVTCGSSKVNLWEVFQVTDVGDGRIALRGNREGRFCADSGRGLVCDQRDAASAAFRTVTDAPLRGRIVQTRDAAAAATFQVHRREPGSAEVAMRCKGDGNYLTIDRSTGLLGCTSPTPATILTSRVDWWDAKSASFSSPSSGLYVKAVEPSLGGAVIADNDEGTGWALWRVLLTGGYEALRPLVRGVNLGNWFLLERWMANDLFFDEQGRRFEDECRAVDEYGLMDALEPEVAARRMEKHWASWIIEEDIRWMADHGINTVRVPFGYWMVFPSPPFIAGQLKYLDKLFEWCERHSIAVLLDFHGLKGSQTGNPTSGNCGACGNSKCGETRVGFLDEQDTNLQVIDKLTSRYSDSPAYLGFAVANEVSSTASSMDTMKFYQKAYDIIRSKREDALVVLFATFNPSTYPFRNFRSVVEDIHIYFGMGFGHPTLDQHENMERARKSISGLNWNVLVGEWSLGANGQITKDWNRSASDAYYAQYAKMQLQTWETYSTGWFYWNYKTRFGNSTWNFRDMCNLGWLPGCKEELQYAPLEWWSTPACEYAYLDGGCPPPPFVQRWWPTFLALATIGIAVAALAVIRPPCLLTCIGAATVATAPVAATMSSTLTGLVSGHSSWANAKPNAGAALLPDREPLARGDSKDSSKSGNTPSTRGTAVQPFIW